MDNGKMEKVMERLTILKALSVLEGDTIHDHGKSDREIRGISLALDACGVKWGYENENGKWIARLKEVE